MANSKEKDIFAMACINLARLGLVLLACVVVAVVAEDAAPVELDFRAPGRQWRQKCVTECGSS